MPGPQKQATLVEVALDPIVTGCQRAVMTTQQMMDHLAQDDRWTSSVIRDLLVHSRRADLISLAGGLPATELLPIERLEAANRQVLRSSGALALQYGLTAGEPILREQLTRSAEPDIERIVVTAGSQQALDLVARLLAESAGATGGTPPVVAIEDPGYLGAVQIFRSHRFELAGIPVDADGICVEALAERLAAGLCPRLCYINPTFQNPTGASLTPERARRLVELAEQYGFWVVADDPYVELSFDGAADSPLPQSCHVIRLGSMSKTLSPGLRVGWLDADPRLVAQVTLAKQAADLHTSTLNQLLTHELLTDSAWWTPHLAALRTNYRDRRDQLRAAVEHHLPQAQISRQRGGFFLWCDLGVDVDDLLPVALEHGVAFVPGSAFAIDTSMSTSLRLSYSSGDPTQFDEALRRLAGAVSA